MVRKTPAMSSTKNSNSAQTTAAGMRGVEEILYEEIVNEPAEHHKGT